jgi:hypothetical protein
MKIKSGYILREIAGTHVVIPTGAAAVNFSGMINLNGTGAFLWKHLEAGKNAQELLPALMEEYEIDEANAEADISGFLEQLKAADLLE